MKLTDFEFDIEKFRVRFPIEKRELWPWPWMDLRNTATIESTRVASAYSKLQLITI